MFGHMKIISKSEKNIGLNMIISMKTNSYISFKSIVAACIY